MSRHTRLFLTVLGCAVCVVALLVIVSSCVEPVGPFDNPYDPGNPDSPFSYDVSPVSGTGRVTTMTAAAEVTFEWSVVDHALRYHLQVARNGRFSDVVHDDEVPAGTTAVAVELEAGSRYHWRVRYEAEVTHNGTTSESWGLWCGPWEVTVASEDLGDGDGDIPFDAGQSFPVGVDSAVELVLEPELHGGLTNRWFEPLIYQLDGSQLDSMTALEGNLATLPIASIAVDGDLSDWGGISPFATDDDGNDSFDVVPGSDLTDFYLGRGERDELYVGFRLFDDQTNPESIYVFHLADSGGFGWGSPGFAVYHDGSEWRGAVTDGTGLPDGDENPGAADVTYDGNGASAGTAPTDPTPYNIDETVTVLSPPGDLRGPAIQDEITQRFIQWNTESDGSGTGYDTGASLSMPENGVTLYAQWTSGSGVIGKIGPAGGYVFYDDEEDGIDDLPGTRYLEAAPAETEWAEKVWGGYGTEVGTAAQGTAIGTGAANTAAIVAAYGDAEPYEGRSDYAAKLADDLSHNGYDDWFLPSKDELNEMYQSGIFIGDSFYSFSDFHWSSSEYFSEASWVQNLGSSYQGGSQTLLQKRFGYLVRAIRAFPNPIDYSQLEVEIGFDANGADGGTPPAAIIDTYGATVTLPGAGTLAQTGYAFAGWNTQPDGLGTAYAAGGTYATDADVTLYAQWAEMPIMVEVPAGSFQRDGTETNISIISQPFHMSEHQITQSQFEAVMGTNPSHFNSHPDSPNKPVEQVSWYDVITFANKLSLLEGLTPVYSVDGISDWTALGYGEIPTSDNADWNAATADWDADGYRLPTEMEWMWAAMGADQDAQAGAMQEGINRTGYSKPFAGYDGSNVIDDYAWYRENSAVETHPVGTKLPNELGLYDMSGNVSEWNWDWYGTYPSGEVTDYVGAASGSYRVRRGGSWDGYAAVCTVANRGYNAPQDRGAPSIYGFRLVRP